MFSNEFKYFVISDTTQKYDDILDDVFEHIKYYVYLNRKFAKDGTVHRYVEAIGELQKDGKMKVIFEKGKK